MDATLLPDVLWNLLEPLLPVPPRRPKRTAARLGSRVSDRHCLRPSQQHSLADAPTGTRCGSGMTCWRRLRDWQQAGVWALIHFALLDWLARDDQVRAREQAPSDLRRAGVPFAAALRTGATAAAAGLCSRGSRLRRDGDSARTAVAAHRAVSRHASYRAREWIGPVALGRGADVCLAQSVSPSCACGMTSGPTVTRRSSRWGARSFVGNRCERRG